MKRNSQIIIIVGVLVILILFVLIIRRPHPGDQEPRTTTTNTVPTENVDGPTLIQTTYEIQPGDTFSSILNTHEDLAPQSYTLTQVIAEIFDVTKIRAGNVVRFFSTPEAFASMEMDINDEEMLVLTKTDGEFEAAISPIEYTVIDAYSEGVIEDSFYIAGTENGLTGKAILEIARIFSWDIDFTTNIQEGDSFAVFFENTYRDREFTGVGNIIAARFTNEGENFYAFMITNDDGSIDYYNEKGESTKRILLKSPLNYSRVSSGFSYSRKHPVLDVARPHTGVDFAAPAGTPIESVGDGVVESAGWNGGYGRYIRIRHERGYKTAYGHLDTISSGIRSGSSVSQGQLIGTVGSTGLSTGPHLHYEVIKDGRKINPLTVKLPPGKPIPESQQPLLDAAINEYFEKLQ